MNARASRLDHVRHVRGLSAFLGALSTPAPHPRTLLYGDLVAARGARSPGSRSLAQRAAEAGWAASAFVLWPERAALLVEAAPDGQPLVTRLLPEAPSGVPLVELLIPPGMAPDAEATLIALEVACARNSAGPILLPYEALSATDDGFPARQMLCQLMRLAEAHERLTREATCDPMTALPTQAYLQRRLRDALHVAEPFALLVVDGAVLTGATSHSYGERAALLRQFGALLVATLGADDEVGHGRLAEEFMILLPRASAAHARAHAEGIIESVRRYPWPLHVTLSIGVALFPEDGTSADALIRAAERAAMVAKAEARDAVVLHRALAPQP